jgi:hypothetical protein
MWLVSAGIARLWRFLLAQNSSLEHAILVQDKHLLGDDSDAPLATFTTV